jgi:hypothetical protein
MSERVILYGGDGRPAVSNRATIGTSEVVRSFSYKLRLTKPDGSPSYESADFFACSKAQCDDETRAEISGDLDQFCMDEVLESIRKFIERRNRKQARNAA